MILGVGLVVLMWMLALVYCDLRYRRLPNLLTVPLAIAAIAVGVVATSASMIWGALALSFLYLVVHLVAPRAMGAGDVKLAISTGALTGSFGIDTWFLAAIGAPLLTGFIGLALLVAGRRQAAVPHGPSMCLSTGVAVLLSAIG